MDTLMCYEIALVIPLIQLFIGIWVHVFPTKKIQNPSKSLTAQCCYYSELASKNIELWRKAQKIYAKWNLRLFLPSILSTLLAVTIFTALVNTETLTLTVLLLYCCCISISVLFMINVRIRTGRDLKAWNDETLSRNSEN